MLEPTKRKLSRSRYTIGKIDWSEIIVAGGVPAEKTVKRNATDSIIFMILIPAQGMQASHRDSRFRVTVVLAKRSDQRRE